MQLVFGAAAKSCALVADMQGCRGVIKGQHSVEMSAMCNLAVSLLPSKSLLKCRTALQADTTAVMLGEATVPNLEHGRTG